MTRTTRNLNKDSRDREKAAVEPPRRQLDLFISQYSPEVAKLARKAFATMRKRLPTAHVLVYDNYNALAIGFAPTERASDAIFSLALWPKWVSLFFLQGAGLRDPDGLLCGSGVLARHIVLKDAGTLDLDAVRLLMAEAITASQAPLPTSGRGRIVIKSVSQKQRARRPAIIQA